ncbi:hypothetical protein CGC58_11275 [Capnocytophaga stomatis]|uniref:Uncharacterized protein n=1 Tax=Capnocytophaga stomatis TaxID=1848904 RepID=A0A250G0I8_9FLAO|nr:hypothetical protein CGC58_11275 [Capnocytophaga stomatis]
MRFLNQLQKLSFLEKSKSFSICLKGNELHLPVRFHTFLGAKSHLFSKNKTVSLPEKSLK